MTKYFVGDERPCPPIKYVNIIDSQITDNYSRNFIIVT